MDKSNEMPLNMLKQQNVNLYLKYKYPHPNKVIPTIFHNP